MYFSTYMIHWEYCVSVGDNYTSVTFIFHVRYLHYIYSLMRYLLFGFLEKSHACSYAAFSIEYVIISLSHLRMKFQWRSFGYKSKVVVLCSVANFINAADRVLMPLAIVPMANEYKWSLYWQGWILSAFAFGYFTSQVCLLLFYFWTNIFVSAFGIIILNFIFIKVYLTAIFIDYILLQIIGANAVNNYGGRRVLCFAVLLWSLSTIVTPLAAAYLPALITARVILGLGEGLGKSSV